MARNGSGTMSISATFTTGTTIASATMNSVLADIGSEITNSMAKDGQTTMTGQFKGADGTVSAPGLTFGSDLNTGFYRIGTDNVGLSLGGTKIVDLGASTITITNGVTFATNTAAITGGSVTGITDVAIADGGTGASTAAAAMDALSPVTTRGDIIYRSATTNARLAIGAANTVLVTDGTDPSWAKIGVANITDAVITYAKFDSAVTAAQAGMETASSTTTIVTPGRQHFHPGHAKAWAFVANGTTALTTDYGCASVSDDGVGTFTLTFDTAFSNANAYVCGGGTARGLGGGSDDAGLFIQTAATKTTTTFQAKSFEISGFSAIDSVECGLIFMGDL